MLKQLPQKLLHFVAFHMPHQQSDTVSYIFHTRRCNIKQLHWPDVGIPTPLQGLKKCKFTCLRFLNTDIFQTKRSLTSVYLHFLGRTGPAG